MIFSGMQLIKRMAKGLAPAMAGLVVFLSAWVPTSLKAERLFWSSNIDAVNLRSNGGTMQGDYAFELGVFTGGFIPTSANTTEWAAHWVAAQRVSYMDRDSNFSGVFTVENNDAPFTVGANAYIWGFGGEGPIKEWILFRRTTWTWPAPNPFNPFTRNWNANAANVVVLGSIQASGSPYLMKSAAMVDGRPVITWDQWAASELAATTLDSPSDDPDLDGTPNALEFIYGTAPLSASLPTATPAVWRVLGSEYFLQISVPRRLDRTAAVVVEISSDLVTWNSGPEWTETMEDSTSALVVRDLTPLSAGLPKRFMRVRVSP